MKQQFTPTEAAAITDLPVRYIQKAIDEGPLKAARRRTLDFDDLVFLYVVGHVDSGLIQITTAAKKQLRKKIQSAPRLKGDLLVGGAVFQLKPAMRAVRSRLAKLRQAKRMVVRDPEIRGGLPVIKGTRIGVYEVATMLADPNETEEEFLAGYPTLKREQLELSKIYAVAYPRRGRPPRHPWHIAAERPRKAAA
jgi:uncharacterized protein (DUF433 family)